MMRNRIIATLLCSLAIAGSAVIVAPRPTHAQLIVHDPLNWIQNTISATFAGKGLLNPVFYRIAQATIQSMVRSTVRWINSGFQGSPAYATDIKSSIQDATDQQIQGFIREFQSNLGINSPFRDDIAQQLLQHYFLSTSQDSFFLQNPYTLNTISPNDVAFQQGDFTQGGFQSWLAAWLNPANNKFGALYLAQTELQHQQSSIASQVHEELSNGNGFFSYRKCDVKAPVNGTSGGQVGSIPILDANGKPTGQTQAINTAVTLSANNTCLQDHIETPGSVIAGTINHTLGLGADSLVQAKEFDEIVNALMGQLLNNVLGPSGLGGLSSGSTATGGNDYFSQPSNNTTQAGTSALASFLQILDSQTQQLQSYLTSWQTINNVALAAKTAVEQSTCMLEAEKQATIDAQIQPVINQAATAIGTVPTSLNSIDRIRSEVIGVASASADTQTKTIQNVSAEYQNLLAGNTIPDITDITYATTQAKDTGSTTPVSLYTQMNQLLAQANTCAH